MLLLNLQTHLQGLTATVSKGEERLDQKRALYEVRGRHGTQHSVLVADKDLFGKSSSLPLCCGLINALSVSRD